MTNSYDQLIYPALARPESHPYHIATIAKLYGIEGKDPKKAKILEIGCGTGENLIPLAEQLPDSYFLGIDLSEKQIQIANDTVKDLNFTNITFNQKNISDFLKEKEKFDYIICHGVFSWVNKTVQEDILKIMSKNLSDLGLGFISYNTLPGWATKTVLRDMMRYHTDNIENIEEKTQQAKALLQFLEDSQTDPADPYNLNLQISNAELKSCPSYYLFHEYLEENNLPLYFHEFVKMLNASNLMYIGDAQYSLSSASDINQESLKLLYSIEDRIKFEQYLDFIRNRKLRESIICKQGKQITYPVKTENINDLFIAGDFKEYSEKSSEKGKLFVLTTSNGGQISTDNIFVIESLKILHELYPQQIKFEDLLLRVSALTSIDLSSENGASLKKTLQEEFLLLYSANLIELKLYDYGLTDKKQIRPSASKFARHQALKQERVISLRHKSVPLESIVRQVLFLLDGTRDLNDIKNEIARLCKTGELKIESNEQKISDSEFEDFLTTIIQRSLNLLIRSSFVY